MKPGNWRTLSRNERGAADRTLAAHSGGRRGRGSLLFPAFSLCRFPPEHQVLVSDKIDGKGKGDGERLGRGLRQVKNFHAGQEHEAGQAERGQVDQDEQRRLLSE